jgi:hypothetical protein
MGKLGFDGGGSSGGGGGGTFPFGGNFTNYAALPLPSANPNYLFYCINSQGTKWLPGSLGGTYYPSGWYYSDGLSYSYQETPFQALQATVNSGTNNDQFLTPKTFNDSAQLASITSDIITLNDIISNKETTSRTIYIDSVSGLDTNDGALLTPKQSILAVLQSIKSYLDYNVIVTISIIVGGGANCTINTLCAKELERFKGLGKLWFTTYSPTLVTSGLTVNNSDVNDPFTHDLAGGTFTTNQFQWKFLKDGSTYIPIRSNTANKIVIPIINPSSATEIYSFQELNINLNVLKCNVPITFSTLIITGQSSLDFRVEGLFIRYCDIWGSWYQNSCFFRYSQLNTVNFSNLRSLRVQTYSSKLVINNSNLYNSDSNILLNVRNRSLVDVSNVIIENVYGTLVSIGVTVGEDSTFKTRTGVANRLRSIGTKLIFDILEGANVNITDDTTIDIGTSYSDYLLNLLSVSTDLKFKFLCNATINGTFGVGYVYNIQTNLVHLEGDRFFYLNGYSSIADILTTKVDKLTGATAGFLPVLDVNGNIANQVDPASLGGVKPANTTETAYNYLSAYNASTGAFTKSPVSGVIKTLRNESGSSIAKGKLVYISGYNNVPLISLASNLTLVASHDVYITTAAIANNANGDCLKLGALTGIDTDSFSAVGADLYMSTSGNMVENPPASGAVIKVAEVLIKDNNGAISFNVELDSRYFAAHGAENLVTRMGDSIGTNKVSFRNYANTEVASIDSLGNATFTNKGTANGYAGLNASQRLAEANSPIHELSYAIDSQISDATSGTKITDYIPYAFVVSTIQCTLKTAPTGGTLFTIDIKKNGTSIFSTKITFDASEVTIATASTPYVLVSSPLTFAAGDKLEIIIDTVGSTVVGVGPIMKFIGYKS